ncbi:hypothetical protein MMC12_005095 [Toensbergia leucococca]|nr:hypothetical protein [Toensbergia leucococca]
MSILFYRRPDYIAKAPGPMNLTTCQRYVERTQKHKRAIPPELSFENVVQNKALPPCSLQDFMDYLVYVSHDAENLQFWLWIQDYIERFDAAPKSEQVLSPQWEQDDVPTVNVSEQHHRTLDKAVTTISEYEVNFDYKEAPLSPTFDKQSFMSAPSTQQSALETVEDANAQIGLKWQSFTIQPFRSEINRVISHYLAPNSPRELNLSHKNRTAVLHALQHTTHPSALSLVKDMVECTLRGQSHPNFIRWSICNGNRPRVIFVRYSASSHIVMALVMSIALVLSSKSRWWRLFAALPFWTGISGLVAAFKGLCVILHKTHGRALRPWEQYGDNGSLSNYDDEENLSTTDIYSLSNRSKRGISMDTFGTGNSFDHEVWIEKYRAKPYFRKVFDRSVWTQDDAVRVVQDRIVLQSNIWALIILIPIVAMFTSLPEYHYY